MRGSQCLCKHTDFMKPFIRKPYPKMQGRFGLEIVVVIVPMPDGIVNRIGVTQIQADRN
jgi:hypothetical protein